MGRDLTEYTITEERYSKIYPQTRHIFAQHYSDMAERLAGLGVQVSPYTPRQDRFFEACEAGYLKMFVPWCDGVPVGYFTVFLTSDMHNGDLIAGEDALYVLKPHRKGIGRQLIIHVLDYLRASRVKRFVISATTDVRIIPLLRRMGFKEVATQMMFTF